MSGLNQEQSVDLQALVIARVSVLSPETGISVGLTSSIKRDELIAHIKAGDEIGRQFIAMDWQFLQSLKTGEIYEAISQYS